VNNSVATWNSSKDFLTPNFSELHPKSEREREKVFLGAAGVDIQKYINAFHTLVQLPRQRQMQRKTKAHFGRGAAS